MAQHHVRTCVALAPEAKVTLCGELRLERRQIAPGADRRPPSDRSRRGRKAPPAPPAARPLGASAPSPAAAFPRRPSPSAATRCRPGQRLSGAGGGGSAGCGGLSRAPLRGRAGSAHPAACAESGSGAVAFLQEAALLRLLPEEATSRSRRMTAW